MKAILGIIALTLVLAMSIPGAFADNHDRNISTNFSSDGTPRGHYFGSYNSPVCGAFLCGQSAHSVNISAHAISFEYKSYDKIKIDAVERATSGGVGATILSAYHQYKQSLIQEVEIIPINDVIIEEITEVMIEDVVALTNGTDIVVLDLPSVPEDVTKLSTIEDVQFQEKEHSMEEYSMDGMKDQLDEYCTLSSEEQLALIEEHDYSKHTDRIAQAEIYCTLDEQGRESLIESFKSEYQHKTVEPVYIDKTITEFVHTTIGELDDDHPLKGPFANPDHPVIIKVKKVIQIEVEIIE